jgi:glutaconate CoA-transferase subunit B
VKKVDFLTTPGYLSGPGARERAGLPEGSGPYRVITQLGVYEFDDGTKKIKLISAHPGVTLEEIEANTEFDIIMPEKIEATKTPTEEEVKILQEIDPLGISLKG